MANVTFLPGPDTAHADVLDSLLETALDNSIDLDHNCGGNCACTTCAVIVEQGAELLSAMKDDERETLSENDKLLPNVRLACQSRILHEGDILVTRVG